ncbi:MAG: S8 family serine peptidase, partial [Armatimonadetes bacterium]|nr:S8 family serine peptidase [Armatimonadota bacterium]
MNTWRTRRPRPVVRAREVETMVSAGAGSRAWRCMAAVVLLALAGAASAQAPAYYYPRANSLTRQDLGLHRGLVAVRLKDGVSPARARVSNRAAANPINPVPLAARDRDGMVIYEVTGSLDDARAQLRASADVQAVLSAWVVPGSTTPLVETDRLCVGLRPGADRQAIWQQYGLSPLRRLTPSRGENYLVRILHPEDGSPLALANALVEEGDHIAYAHPDFLVKVGYPALPQTRQAVGVPLFIPNDARYGEQWHLNNTAQRGGTPGADVRAEAAWDNTRGSGAVIAVIDDSFDLDHEDFNAAGKIVDPYDAYNDDNNPRPDDIFNDAHGTAVSGVATAVGNNGIGVSGVAPDAALMPIKIGSFGSFAGTAEMAAAFDWALANGATVCNNSWFYGMSPIPVMENAITALAVQGRGGRGTPVLFASGNFNVGVYGDDGNADTLWPQHHPEVWVVGGSDHDDIHVSYSDTGDVLDIVTPTQGGDPGDP